MKTPLSYRLIAGTVALYVLAWLTFIQPAVAAPCNPVGLGDTVYGVTNLGGPQGAPVFIPNNFTCLNDIMASPGGGFALTFPVVGNNIAQFGPTSTPFFSAWTGGGNRNGPFGAALTLVTPSTAAFLLSNARTASSSVSYMITSWESRFIAPAAGQFLGTYLSIGGFLPALGSADAVALQSEVSVNGGAFIALPTEILAFRRNGPPVLSGNSVAFLQLGTGFEGLAVDRFGLDGLAGIRPGDNLVIDSTLTALADPASIDSIVPDPTLVNEVGGLPEYSLADTGAQIPEPSTLGLLGTGFVGIAAFLRKRVPR
jgi:PEP-CTERM motif